MAEWVTRIDWAIQRISEGVITGEFAPGQRLKAQDLAAEWEVSATPVREALQRLTTMGLVQAVPNRGVRVAPIVVEELREVYSLRLLLEPLALRVSLENRDEAWESKVRETYEALRRHLEDGPADLIAFERAHGAFHDALLENSGSVWLARITDMLGAHSVRYRLLSLGPRGGQAEVLAEHEGLYEACMSGDVDDAVARLFAHIRLTVDSISDSDEGDRLASLIDAAGGQVHAGLAR
jgi:GntR family carbon starvation induced transcriptional regulator